MPNLDLGKETQSGELVQTFGINSPLFSILDLTSGSPCLHKFFCQCGSNKGL